jgi:catechol 2,3-dioxygenase-like lactoylglutathione lyase family enzyme
MRRIASVLVVALVCLAVAPVSGSEEAYEGAHFKRVTLIVADMDRSLKIYRDILGFQLDGIMEATDGESYSYPVFKIDPDADIRFGTLSAGTEQIRTMALTEVKGMELPKPGRPLMTATVIRVDELDATFEKLEALGVETVPGKIAERPGEFRFKERAFIDFDGHLIVLYELLPLEE